MSPELQKQLADMLAKLMSAAEQSTTWVGGQIPPLVQEKILFGRINGTIQLALAAGVLFACVTMARHCLVKLQGCDDEMGWMLGLLVTGAGAIGACFATAMQIEAVLMVWFAPRLYIVEWLRALIKG